MKLDIPQGYYYRDNFWVCPIDSASMLYVPGGPFWMGYEGKSAYVDERPRHEIYLEPFLVDAHKVSVESYQRFLQSLQISGGHHLDWCHPEEPYGKSHVPQDWEIQVDHPKDCVRGIDWYDALCYASWAGKTLPTEAQWERSCNYILETNGLAGKEMIGLGLEWCMDWYLSHYYQISPRYEPYCSMKNVEKALKGNLHSLPLNRSSMRFRYAPRYRDDFVGFRCVKRVSRRHI